MTKQRRRRNMRLKKNLDEQTAWCIFAAPGRMKAIRRKSGIMRNQLLVMNAWTWVVCLDWMDCSWNYFVIRTWLSDDNTMSNRRNLHWFRGSQQRLLDTFFQAKNDFLMDFPLAFSRLLVQICNQQTKDFNKFWLTESLPFSYI